MNLDIFSPEYPATFTVHHIRYRSLEQYYLAQKAGPDPDLFEKILLAKPEILKTFVDAPILNFSEEVWREDEREVLKSGNFAKFAQNQALKDALVETGSEAIKTGWALLDEVLMEVRGLLREVDPIESFAIYDEKYEE